MTDKTEHEGAPASAAQETETTAPVVVPSIIVDPGLTLPTATEGANAAAGSTAPHSNGGAQKDEPRRVPAPVAAADDSRLSDEEADRLAAGIRPSWEPPAGKDYAGSAPAAAISSAAPAKLPMPAPADEEVRGVPGSQRRRGVLITGGAVLGFCALAALGLITSRTDVPRSKPAARAPQAAATQTRPEASGEAKPAAPASATPQVAPAPPAPPLAAVSPVVAAGSGAELPPGVTLAGTEPAPAAADATALPPAVLAPTAPAPLAPAAPAALAAAAPIPPAAPAPVPTSSPAPVAASPRASAAATAAKTSAPAPPAAAVATPAPARSEPRTVRMQFSAKPASARLSLDGSSIPNPFEADVIRGGKHRLRAHAEGHRSEDITVSFDRDRELTLELDPIAAPRPRPRAKAKSKTRQQATVSAAASPAPKPPPPPESSASRGAGFVTESPY